MHLARGESAVADTLSGDGQGSRRWTVFVYQDGVILCPTLSALDQLGVLEPSLACESSVSDLLGDVDAAGFGYLRVGLRSLASQGWLAGEPTLDPATTVLRWTDAGRGAARHFDDYIAVGEFLAQFSSIERESWSRPWRADQTASLVELTDRARDRWSVDPELPVALRALITTHLDAGLAVPAMLWLRGAGRVAGDGPMLPESDAGEAIGSLLTAIGWLGADRETWTPEGRQAAAHGVHFGMAASYLPLLARLPTLYRGGAVVAPEPGTAEWHVHRPLNVIASTAAHRRYFDDADGIFIDVFDREPVSAQPRFIVDMGCGDGSWLVHLHKLITERTRRGRQLDADPLLMVGLDYNPAALDLARRVLADAGVPALLALGDISDPDAASATLAEHGLAIQDGLHIRAFVDHERAYTGADPSIPVAGCSSGAYVDPRGRPLDGAAIERDLVVHLRRWAPFVREHGLVILEAHCVAPRIAREHLGATHSVAFDAYHGYSHQYPIEHSAFLRCCREAGLRPASHCERRYPASRPFVAVSLNRLLVAEREQTLPALNSSAARADTWHPDPGLDLEDGKALHELLYVDGDLRYPRVWCSAATGFVVSGALEVVEERLATGQPGDAIRVLDYGAGTGLAAIELLKACRDRGLERRLERREMTLELHLVDLPSGWFAQGFELLRDCAWTQFHSLRSPVGGFRALLDVTGGRLMDAVMANMVFHLVPVDALGRAAAELASVATPAGRLLWSSPDLGPAGPYAVLFHDANRALRTRWLERGGVGANNGAASAQARADRRVLPIPNRAQQVAEQLSAHFTAEARLERPTHEILADDLLDTLLVPSNQSEFLAEIDDRTERENLIRELMLGEVLPAMQRRAGGTAVGLNVQWTLGMQTRG
jgi:SAM-dependent methyltransferase